MPQLPWSSRWLAPSNGGTNGRQVPQVETARPEAEGRRQDRERSRDKGQARQLQPSPAARGEGQEVAGQKDAARGAGSPDVQYRMRNVGLSSGLLPVSYNCGLDSSSVPVQGVLCQEVRLPLDASADRFRVIPYHSRYAC